MKHRRTLFSLVSAVLAVTHIVVMSAAARADSYSIIDPDDNTQIMQEVANALADVERIYNTGPLTARTRWLGDRAVYASAIGNNIYVNKAWSTGSYEEMAASIDSDIVAGFHNGGCSPIRTIALHEAAHIINNKRGGLPVWRAIVAAGIGPRPDLRGTLSGYSFDGDGSVDPSEALAEAFQAVVCGSAGANDRRLYNMLVN